ncbi:hypothetical protein B0T17DRAFT_601028 [Bombardia bombarda]|uniref:Rhodopsin domain-containing protein n=1 Tax=Bombardia bombarda TaxID=252184 RepID=A0AA40BY24_9PEZI|nr:hypothetical protein B0T17DRAFT_601028 [Bombardia bombarda]
MSDSSKDSVLALGGALMGLSMITVGLRFWTRKHQQIPLMADDWTALLAMLAYIGACITVFVMVHNKVLGYSTYDFTPEQLSAMARTDLESEIVLGVFTTTTLACVKLSALFFYRRVFCYNTGEKRTVFSTLTWITIAIVVVWLVVFQFLTGFQCGTHFSALWDGTYLQYCTISIPFLYGIAISDVLLDIWILLLPIPGITRLNTSWARKLSIIGVFLIALIGLDYLYTDPERLVTQSFFYTMLESGIALIAVNLPSLRVFPISLKTREILRSVRSLIELSFIRGSSTNVAGSDPEAPRSATGVSTKKEGKAASVSTRPSASSHGQHQDFASSHQQQQEQFPVSRDMV